MISKELRKSVFERDKYKCHYCGKFLDPQGDLWSRPSLDHIFPKLLGGKDTIENLITSCKMCNSKKGIKMLPNLRPFCKFCEFRMIKNRESYCSDPAAKKNYLKKWNQKFDKNLPEKIKEQLIRLNHERTSDIQYGIKLGWITKRNSCPDWCDIWTKRERTAIKMGFPKFTIN